MSRKIYQYRYYGDNNAMNQPTGLTKEELMSGTVFEDRTPVVQLGVQACPGTELNLNNSLYNVIIGSTGVYELDVSTGAYIKKITFKGSSINTTNGVGIIIDTVYGEDE